MTIQETINDMESRIISGYEDGLTAEGAEELAGRLLVAQMALTRELKNQDLDSRMKKSGLKAVRAAAYKSLTSNVDKKPTEASLSASIDLDDTVAKQQDEYDSSEVRKLELERYYDIFNNAHILYRGVSKGHFE